jgi:RHS repeat-associated protein
MPMMEKVESMGGLDVTELLTDATGNLVSDYVYGAGTTPISRLAANGTAVYYLTDAMGSVIGEVDGAGNLVNSISYDAFGNIRSQTGTARSDFRFQGQWLESDSGLYYFRARDYDPKSGLFLSRDAVEPIQEAPESANPYQFAYQNPNVYSDPSGMLTMSDINAAQVIDNILEDLYRRTQGRISRRVIEQAKGVVTDILSNTLDKLLPYSPLGQILIGTNGGDIFEAKFKEAYCGIVGLLGNLGSLVYNSTYFEAAVYPSGEPKTDGYQCNDLGTSLARRRRPAGTANPDFIIKGGTPPTVARIPPAFLTGDIKLSGNIKTSGKQWNAIINHSKPVYLINPITREFGYQFVPVAAYITLYRDGSSAKTVKAALREGIILKQISFFGNRLN